MVKDIDIQEAYKNQKNILFKIAELSDSMRKFE
jgi:hypothetical protein